VHEVSATRAALAAPVRIATGVYRRTIRGAQAVFVVARIGPVGSDPSAIRSQVVAFYVLDACALFDVPVTGLIHVGANRGKEYPTYRARTHGPLLYVEAIPEMAEFVRQRLDPQRPHFLRQAVVSDVAGETVSFHVASNDGGSSSLLAPGRHADLYPSITFEKTLELVTERLDDIVAERPEGDSYNVLLLDVQGAELKVLQGAPELLARVDAVFAEVSSEPLYEGGCTFLEVTNLLAEAGQVFRAAEMNTEGWGDAFYSRSRGTLHDMLQINLALGRPTRQSSYYGRTGQAEHVVGEALPLDFGAHTAVGDDNPWWEVDLGDVTQISRIIYLDRHKYVERGASLRISTSADGDQYDVVYKRDGKPIERIVDVAAPTNARFVRVSLEDGGPLHFRQVIVL
jgi:FkbM family methyltransferase